MNKINDNRTLTDLTSINVNSDRGNHKRIDGLIDAINWAKKFSHDNATESVTRNTERLNQVITDSKIDGFIDELVDI